MDDIKRHRHFKKAKKRVRKLRDFYSHFLSYILTMFFLLGINLLTSPDFLWVLFPLLGWGLGLSFHALAVFGAPGFSTNWEEQRIKRELYRMEMEEEGVELPALEPPNDDHLDLDSHLKLDKDKSPGNDWIEDELV